MGENIKVSVIIPVYNAEKYLRQCLDSVVNQTLREIEIICVDDASTDGSKAILQEYAERDSRVVPVFYAENMSASQARKDGVMLAKGQYIMFLDADDTYELTACKELSVEMDKRNVDILQFGTYVDALPSVATETVVFFERFAEPYLKPLEGREVFDACFKSKKYRFTIWNKIYRAELCKKAFSHIEDGFFPKAQDLYAYFVISWFAKSYIGIKNKYYHYNYGRGITGDGRAMPLTTFERHCSQSQIVGRCRFFLQSQGATSQYSGVLANIERSLIDECVNCWYNSVAEEDGSEGFRMLLSSWGNASVADAIARKEKGLVEIAARKSMDIDFPRKYLDYASGAARFAFEKEYINRVETILPERYEKIVPIIFAADDNYAVYTGVAIESIICHANPLYLYRVYIINSAVDESHIQILESISTKNVIVRCVNIQYQLDKHNVELYSRAHYTKEMFYRFLIPEVFFNFPRAIYLDGDLIVETDIAKILNVDMGSSYVAAVRNPVSDYTRKHIRSNFSLDADNYFNSGVLVINVEEWQKSYIVKKCFELFKEIPKKLLFCPDQDILNIVCNEKTYFLDPAWNYMWHFVDGTEEQKSLYASVVNSVNGQFKILHFASNIKPWNHPERPLSIYFWKYAISSPFFSEILARNQATAIPMIQTTNTASVGYDRGIKFRAERAEQEIRNIHSSWSYRIGRFITWPYRMVRGFFRCYREHGWRYTWKRVLVHLCPPKYVELARKTIWCYRDHGFRYTWHKMLEKLHLKKSVWDAPHPTTTNHASTAVPANQPKPVKKDYDYYKNLPQEQYATELCAWFKRVTGETLNLENPKTFNEKIQWMKLYDSTPLKTRLADKYLVRDWVKEKIGEEYLIPLLGVWDSFDEIDFDQLPDQFVLKTNHGCAWNIIVKDKSKLDRADAKKKFDTWMQTNFAYRVGLELQYMNIPPKIIAEQYLENGNDDLYDYKVFCFDGKAESVMFLSERKTGLKMAFYDLNWNKLPYVYSYPQNQEEVPKPKNLDLLISLAEKLSEGFAHVRVDFYILNDGTLKFGEMTFTSASGTCKWEPREQNRIYGDLIKLPGKSPIPEKLF